MEASTELSVACRSVGSQSLVLRESLAWLYTRPLLRSAEERIHSGCAPQGKGSEMEPANHIPLFWGWGVETPKRIGFVLRLSLGFWGGWSGHHPHPFLPSTLSSQPCCSALCDSRGNDRAVATTKCLLGVLEPWISLPIAWMQQRLEEEMGMCGAQGWGATATATLGWFPTFPDNSLRTDTVSLKIWCTDTCLHAHCLDCWGIFPQHLKGCHIPTVFTS